MWGRDAFALGGVLLLLSMLTAGSAAAEEVCPEIEMEYIQSKDGGTYRAPQVSARLDGKDQPGDQDGSGLVILTYAGRANPGDVYKQEVYIDYDLTTTKIDIPLTGAHVIQRSRNFGKELFNQNWDQADKNGRITVSKCFAHGIFKKTEDFYVDVHNVYYPDASHDGTADGAIRGQLVGGAV